MSDMRLSCRIIAQRSLFRTEQEQSIHDDKIFNLKAEIAKRSSWQELRRALEQAARAVP